MKKISFPNSLSDIANDSAEGVFHWIDIEITDNISMNDLPSNLKRCLHERHLSDINNHIHPPYYDITDEYEILIFRTVDRRFEVTTPKTRSTSFIIKDNYITTLHGEDDDILTKLHHRWLSSKNYQPEDILMLLHNLLDEIASSYLELREPLNSQIQEWQQRLLDPNDPLVTGTF